MNNGAVGILNISAGTLQGLGTGGEWHIGGSAVTSGTTGYGNLVMSGGLLTTTNNYQIGAYGYGVLNRDGRYDQFKLLDRSRPVCRRHRRRQYLRRPVERHGNRQPILCRQGRPRHSQSQPGSGLCHLPNGMTLSVTADVATTPPRELWTFPGGTISTTYVNMGAERFPVFNFNGGAVKSDCL